MPKARPGKSGITKLWLPGNPGKNLSKVASATPAPAPGKLLQRLPEPSKEAHPAGGSNKSLDVERESQSGPHAAQAGAAAVGDLDWLNDYMEQSCSGSDSEAKHARPQHVSEASFQSDAFSMLLSGSQNLEQAESSFLSTVSFDKYSRLSVAIN